METDDATEVKRELSAKLRSTSVQPIQDSDGSAAEAQHQFVLKNPVPEDSVGHTLESGLGAQVTQPSEVDQPEAAPVQVEECDISQQPLLSDMEGLMEALPSEEELSMLRESESGVWGSHPLQLKEYMQYIRDQVKKIKDIRRRGLIDSLVELGIRSTTAEELTDKLISGKLTLDEIKLNVIPFSEDDARIEIWRKCQSLMAEDLHCLVIIAPYIKRSGFLSRVAAAVGVESFDTQQRLEEMNSFIRCLLDSTDREVICDYYSKQVYNKEDVKSTLDTFFGDGQLGSNGKTVRASGAFASIVLFLGHGCEKGLVLLHDPALPLDDFIEQTKTLWNAAEKQAFNLPVVCEVIFSQCDAHHYDLSVQSERFRVRHMTDKNHPYTVSIRNEDGKYENVELRNETRLFIGPQHLLEKERRLIEQKLNAEESDEQENPMDSGFSAARPKPNA